MHIGLHVKYLLHLSGFNKTHFLNRFSKNTQIPNFMKIRQVEAEMFHAARRTDLTKLMIAFRNYENVSKILRPNNRTKNENYSETRSIVTMLV
jgi:hypothetical protein